MDHFNSGKNLDFKWLFTHLVNGTLEQELKRRSIEDLGEINTQIDYHRQQLNKKQQDTPQLKARQQNMTNGLKAAADITLKVISEKGPRQANGRDVF